MRGKWTTVLSLVLAFCLWGTGRAQTGSGRGGVGVHVPTGSSTAASEDAQKVKCTGKVSDANGQPIEGAKIKLYGLTVSPATFTFDVNLVQELSSGKDGTFTIEAARDESQLTGQAVILVEKDGLAVSWANWHKRQNIDVELKLGEPKVLAGRVVDESGNPVQGADVMLSFMMIGGRFDRYMVGKVSEKLFADTTDAEGRFSFGRIPTEATAELLAKKPGRATISTFDPTTYRGGGLSYSPGCEDIKIEMPVEAKVEGVVVEKNTGKPVGGVRVMVTRGRNRPNFGQEPVVSTKDGTFRIEGLVAGEHLLQLTPQAEGAAEWVAEPVQITAESGKTITGVKVEVSKGGLLEVVVTDAETKKPIGRANLSVRRGDSDEWFGGVSDGEGIARIRLAPGEYKFAGAYKEGYTYDRGEQTVVIEDGKTERMDLALRGQPKISGVVRDPEGKPVEGVKLKVCPVGHQDISSDAEGKFEVRWDPRSWGPEEREMAFYLVARQEERNLAAAVEIEEDARTLDVNVVPAVIFTGKVVDPNGNGIPEAKINVMLQASRWGSPITDWQRGGATADSEGKFEVKAIPPGHKYSVIASAEEYGRNQVQVSSEDAVDNRLAVGEMTLALANLSVSGVVVDLDDKPVANAQIFAYGEGQPDRQNIGADKDGKFVIEKVCAGRIGISANVRGGGRMNGHVETEGGATDVKIVVSERGGSDRFVPREPPSLVGKALPDLNDVGVALSAADANDKMILVCFWDMNQRPSRHCVRQLAQRVEELKEKGVVVAAVQGSKVEQQTLNDWMKKFNVPFPSGMIGGDEEKTRFRWGVRSLPWLILTDKEHVIRAAGFGLGDLDEKIKKGGEQPQ
ncbi:MAG TPA: carboxypeptidase regulatory-like domain-containing protein [Sedimentisphaerales bacterium]|nr:carboxypeptidase regulatory-like domain-containing protein [Sedimentisphaerales bacterium]